MPSPTQRAPIRNLVIVLGDQLDTSSAAFDGFDENRDLVWMAEVSEESTYVWSHKARIAIFLSAMRHFRDTLRERGFPVFYRELEDEENSGCFEPELLDAITRYVPSRLVIVQPGEHRVQKDIETVAKKTDIALEIREDRHFLCPLDEFASHADSRKQLRMEFFYRSMRRRSGYLMYENKPEGERWNFDDDNRQSFGRSGPGKVAAPQAFSPDGITQDVLSLVERRFSDHPGQLARFDWAVTSEVSVIALHDFVANRLPNFGTYQDAMWSREPYLYHSRLSSALNLKLLNPRTVIEAALEAYEQGDAAVASVEGFVRQILGWREYVRGVYWRFMPEYEGHNSLKADCSLPPFYWTAETDMNCLREVIQQTLEYGYAHHIQRLMVTGLFALLLGVNPVDVHRWYLAIYVDAVEWVELPNTLGMSQFADGGTMASKPYIASGNYVARMSNYCQRCRYNPRNDTGPEACPLTTLYWDFLMRHAALLRMNPRMGLQLKNLERRSKSDLAAVRRYALSIRTKLLT
jgi:deoxyribodipyrimidine photolyase-related protein